MGHGPRRFSSLQTIIVPPPFSYHLHNPLLFRPSNHHDLSTSYPAYRIPFTRRFSTQIPTVDARTSVPLPGSRHLPTRPKHPTPHRLLILLQAPRPLQLVQEREPHAHVQTIQGQPDRSQNPPGATSQRLRFNRPARLLTATSTTAQEVFSARSRLSGSGQLERIHSSGQWQRESR